MTVEKCENCRFVGTFRYPSGSQREGLLVCRLNPPVSVQGQRWEFPRVHSEDWCGQYEKVPEEWGASIP